MINVLLISVVLLLAFLMSVMHWLSDTISKIMEVHHYKVLSLSSGTLIAYLFLVLLPEVMHYSEAPEIFFLILIGFIIFHLSEKYLYQHVKNKDEMLKDLKELHIAGFFIDHFLIGFILVTTFEFTAPLGILILLPLFLHTISSSIAMEHIHKKVKLKVNKIVLSSSTFIGALTAIMLNIDEASQALILSFIFGMLLYIVSRDVIPREEKGSPSSFIAGSIIVICIWLLISYIF